MSHPRRTPPLLRVVLALAAALALVRTGLAQPVGDSSIPPSISVQSLVRIGGQGKQTLRGLGLVLGLNGTGDSGKDLVLARPLAQVYANNGNPIPDPAELGNAKSAALVMITCEIPESGARTDDRFDIFVSATHSASSLAGGRLLISPLFGPLPEHVALGAYAMAEGPIIIEDTDNKRVGRIRGGATMWKDINLSLTSRDTLPLIINPEHRGWPTARTIANEINGATSRLDEDPAAAAPPLARAIDEATVVVTIPVHERADPANFIARILSLRFSPTLLDQPATVVVNERTGVITMSADVEISPGAVAYKDLIVTTITPAPTPTPAEPMLERNRWVGIGTSGRASERARLSDLLKALNQLSVPPRDQIFIITQLHDSGRLHAKLVVE